MTKLLNIHEIYTTIQGEGIHSGLPCYFIRTAGCDLRCNWCDTPECFSSSNSEPTSISKLVQSIPDNMNLIQITGGEPLIYKELIIDLINALIYENPGKKILLETGGHHSISGIPEEVHIVMDIKLPDSGEANHDFSANFPHLKREDEIKFVINSRRDFESAIKWIEEYQLSEKCDLLFSPVWGELSLKTLAEWVLERGIRVRIQTQLHRIIWGAKAKGV